jgi:hypothetical protein
MMFPLSPPSEAMLIKALERMAEALEILDQLGAPGEIGSTLDLAIARLRKLFGRDIDLAIIAAEPLNGAPDDDYYIPA